jgi:hypothetical protein
MAASHIEIPAERRRRKLLLILVTVISCLLGFFVSILPLSFFAQFVTVIFSRIFPHYQTSSYNYWVSIGLWSAFVVACLLAAGISRLQYHRFECKSEFEIRRYVATVGPVTGVLVCVVTPLWLLWCFY